MKKKAFLSFLKMLIAAFLLFVLSYFFNPLNDTMRNSLTGPITPTPPGRHTPESRANQHALSVTD